MFQKHKRRVEEFYCGECGNHFETRLRLDQEGEYTIECPGTKEDGTRCGHHHFRRVENGWITETRWSDNKRERDHIIRPLACTASKVPKMNDPDYRRGRMKQVNR